MKPITTFDEKNVKDLRADINAALSKVFAEYGITGKFGTMRYSDLELSTKLSITISNTQAATDIANRDRGIAIMYLKSAGLKMGAKLSDGTYGYNITGYNKRKRSYPVVIQREDGKSFCCSVDMAKRQLIK